MYIGLHLPHMEEEEIIGCDRQQMLRLIDVDFLSLRKR